MSIDRVTADRDNDTICAVATPHGRGGISVIRLSGPRALVITKALCLFVPEAAESHYVYYGYLRDPQSQNEIDEVMVTYFRKGRSFTGEDATEISCHGSPIICERILQALVQTGARLADRGEFTYRAFINGRIDLVQAESVLSLIESQTKESSRVALQQLKGELSRTLEQLESDLTWALAHIEAGIDFSAEGLDVTETPLLIGKLQTVLVGIDKLLESYHYGRFIQEGIRCLLVGLPNAGKSSLLNVLVQQDRAIVTDIPGTTRDVVTAETNFQNFRFSLFDTAGLKDFSEDKVERIGIEKTKALLKEVDYVFFVHEAGQEISPEEHKILENLEPSRSFVLVNKIDLLPQGAKFVFFPERYGISESRVISVCAFEKESRTQIFEAVLKDLEKQESESSVLLVHSRHFEGLSRARALLVSSLDAVQSGASPEFVALDLKQALIFLHEVLGKRFDDQIMDRVFKEFCIGK